MRTIANSDVVNIFITQARNVCQEKILSLQRRNPIWDAAKGIEARGFSPGQQGKAQNRKFRIERRPGAGES